MRRHPFALDHPNCIAPNAFSLGSYCSNAKYPFIDSPVLCYDFNREKNSGGTSLIWQSRGNIGALGNIVSPGGASNPVPLISLPGYYFDGNDQMSVTSPARVKVTTRTICFWAKTGTGSTFRIVFSLGTNYYVGFANLGVSDQFVTSYLNGGAVQVYKSVNNGAVPGSWRFYAVTVETVGADVSVYLYRFGDGASNPIGSDIRATGHSTSFGATMYVGSFGGSSYYAGDVACLRFYDRVYSLLELECIFEKQRSAFLV